jgi:predicted ATPase
MVAHSLVSIVGPGGIGKTRLARAVPHAALRDDFPDGVFIVELAAIGDPQLVSAETARGLRGATDAARTDPESIAAAVATQRLLLVLDNCEHLLEPAAQLADAISRAGSQVRVLVTSQEALKTELEHVYRLDALAVPQAAGAAEAERYGAVELFVRRAQAVQPQFRLTEANAAAVVEICRRLDGIPLALELAAARMPLLGVDGLRARLDERFRVLTGGSRFVLRRHQTLRAALDFSHALLTEHERTIFRRLGVFAGSFALESAQEASADASIDAWEVLECLGGLVDKSMVLAEGEAAPRLRMLETTRAYALEKLADAGETDALLERHARATAARMRPAYDEFWTRPHAEWLARFEPDLDNVRAAFEWGLHNEPALAIELMGDSLKLWQTLALQPEALRRCAAALKHVDERTPRRAAGRLWYAEAMMCANTWSTRSRDAARKAVALLRDTGDAGVLALALARLATWSRAKPAAEQRDAGAELERLESAEWKGQLRWLVPYVRAMQARWGGEVAVARREFERARDIALAMGDSDGALGHQENVGEMAIAQGNLDEAIAMLRDAATDLASRHDRLFHLFALMGIVTACAIKGDAAAARAPFTEAMPLILRYDMVYRYADTAALFAALEGRFATSARLLGYSDACYAERGESMRDENEATAREHAERRLAHVPSAERDAWIREGAQLDDAEAYSEALGRTGDLDAP